MFSDKLPLNFQVFQTLRERIERGELGPGDRLPTEIELAKSFKVGVVTVQRALKDLTSAGLITRHRRRGTFVCSDRAQIQPGHSDALSLMFSDEFESTTKLLGKEIIVRPERLARIFPGHDRLLHIRRLVFRSGTPWSYASIYLVPELSRRISVPMLKRYPMFRLLGEKLRLPLNNVSVNLSAKQAGLEVSRLLKLDPLAPVTLMNATLFDAQGSPLNWLEIFYRGDSFVFRFEMDLRGITKSKRVGS